MHIERSLENRRLTDLWRNKIGFAMAHREMMAQCQRVHTE